MNGFTMNFFLNLNAAQKISRQSFDKSRRCVLAAALFVIVGAMRLGAAEQAAPNGNEEEAICQTLHARIDEQTEEEGEDQDERYDVDGFRSPVEKFREFLGLDSGFPGLLFLRHWAQEVIEGIK